jgi:GAF domain-containing protein
VAGDEAIELAETFGELARSLLAEPDVGTTLTKIVTMAVSTIDHCEHAGITLVEGRSLWSAAVSDEVPAVVDRIQDEVDDGPCYDTIRQQATFRTGNLSAESRWPRFARRAQEETGITSVLSIRLFVEADTLGALNLYSSQPDAFADDDIALASVFAAHAAVAMANEREVAQLHRAIESRDVIGQAKGILMARDHLSDEEAYDVLRRASQRLNTKLRDVAEQVRGTSRGPQGRPR